MPLFPLQKHCCMLANCGSIFVTSYLAGLQYLERMAGEGQRNSSPKNGHSKANHLALPKWGDGGAKLPRSDCAWKSALPLVMPIGISLKQLFCASFKTIFWA
jgi:hypothetical protein